jgi:hypothetical protein
MELGNTVWLIWSLLLQAFMQCQKIPEEDFIAQPTELPINVTTNGDESENTYVYLFRDRTSFESRLGPVAVDTTEEAGRAFFYRPPIRKILHTGAERRRRPNIEQCQKSVRNARCIGKKCFDRC